MSDEEELPREDGPMTRMQDALAELDPSAVLSGFVAVAEWIEEDGSTTFSIVATQMAPWHAYGLLSLARDQARIMPELSYVEVADDEDDE